MDMYRELTIGERLKDMRTNRHLRLEDVAERPGLSKSALGKYESDDSGDINQYADAGHERHAGSCQAGCHRKIIGEKLKRNIILQNI